jgi:hypothetical protein
MSNYRVSVARVKPLGGSAQPTVELLNSLWETWLTARKRALETGLLADGLAAGHAWRRFLEAFTSPQGAAR